MTQSDPNETVHTITDLFAAEPPVQPRPLYWHVFGGPIQNKKAGSSNFALFTAGPVTKYADAQVTETTIAGTDGETFSYLGSFDHDPSEEETTALKPPAFR